MTALLIGKVAFVTGAAQGIGARLATGLAAAGAAVIAGDLDDCAPTVERIVAAGGRAISARVDVTNDDTLASAVSAARDAFGGLDILVNNAALFGTLPPSPIEEIEIETFDRVLRVNVRGVWQAVRAAMPAMQARGGGAVVNIATNRVFRGFPNMLHYDASKGAVLAMTKAMAAELGPRNIRVNAVAPGLTLSENVRAKDGIEDREPRIVAGRALARSQLPEDLIGAVVFLASDLASFVTGQTLVVDGGGVMH